MCSSSAVADDLPGLHAGEGVLDSSPDFAVGGVVGFFPGRQLGLAGFSAVRNDQTGATVAAVGDHGGVADRVLGPGHFPCLAVVAVAGRGPADGGDKT